MFTKIKRTRKMPRQSRMIKTPLKPQGLPASISNRFALKSSRDQSSRAPPAMLLPSLESLLWLQGSPADLSNDIRLGLLIQPNCPGCHMHAVPLANELYALQGRNFDIYCISTAFEDFEYNTIESAEALVKTGRLVGISKRRLENLLQVYRTCPLLTI